MTSQIINLSALEPLYLPHNMPEFHRIRAKREGEPAEIVKGRRTSEIIIAQNLRRYVSEWRDADYTGASDTTRELLLHWFGRDHTIKNSEGESVTFKYYFCQREANILPEQTLGRGLRRMTPPGQATKVVTVVEHKAFVSLYKEQLSQEGLPIEVVDVDKVPKTTVTIYPDKTKDLGKLDIVIPPLSAGFKRTPKLEDITIEDVKKSFSRFSPLPLGEARKTESDYEGRHLFTNEIVEKMMVQLPLLQGGIQAISFYVKELESITRLRGTHSVLASLIQTFLEEILFGQSVSIFDEKLISRLPNADVREYVRATFVPVILRKTTSVEERMKREEPVSVYNWKLFQITHSENRPALPAENTPFNLVPCNREFEVAMTTFLNRAPDIQSFCKNAGPQALKIDYLTGAQRLSFYTPDFIVKKKGRYRLA